MFYKKLFSGYERYQDELEKHFAYAKKNNEGNQTLQPSKYFNHDLTHRAMCSRDLVAPLCGQDKSCSTDLFV